MKYFICLLCIFTLRNTWALSPVVRIDLANCHLLGRSDFSGVLVQQAGLTYVVTSSWAQMSAQLQEPRCERVWSEQGELQVRPIVTDHLAGLALYQVLPSIESLSVPNAELNSAVLWTLKFNELVSTSGQIVIANSRRHHIPAWDRVLEWQGDLISSEAIGAGIWMGGQWLGITSHEFLQPVSGAKTKVGRWNLQLSIKQSHLILISAADISLWMQKQISKPIEQVIWPPEDQKAGVDRWISGDLEFSAQCPSDLNPNPGGEYPIGGGDGFGIGGDSIQNKACKLKTALSSKWHSPWLAKSLQVWEAGAQQELLQNKEIIFWYGLSREQDELAKDYFFSVESMFKVALNQNKNWVELRSDFVPPTGLVTLVKTAKQLQAESLDCYNQLFIREPNVQELVRKLFFFALLTQSKSWQMLQPNDVATTFDRNGFYAQGWKMLAWEGSCNNPRLLATADNFLKEHKKVWFP